MNKIWLVLATLFAGFLTWLICPTVSLGYAGSAFFWGFILIMLIWAAVPAGLGEEIAIGASAVIVCLWFFVVLTGWGLFRADDYYTQLGTPQQKEFTSDIVPIDIDQLPVVDVNLAAKLGDKRLGEEKALGSQVEVGEFTMQNVDGKLVLVAPLLHRGFFQWWENDKGTPGYIVVSATNQQDVRLVQELNEKPIFLKYQTGAYWGDDLVRHVWSNGYATKGITDYSFEIDDQGNPFYVLTRYKTTIGWAGGEALGVLIVNAQTGEIDEYSIENTPAWVDRIQPKKFVISQVANWGDYVHGYINLDDKDRLRIADQSNEDKSINLQDGTSLVYSKGVCYFYMGLTSVGKDEGTVGFILINSRTKEAAYYHMTGAYESSAMKSAQGKVQNYGYKATQPYPINLDGVPTYFLTLKDSEGLIKQYAMVNISDYSIVGIGDTIREAKGNYKAALYTSGNAESLSQTASMKSAEGIVQRISSLVQGGDTYYYLMIDTIPGQILVAKYDISIELPNTIVSDKVQVSYVDSGNSEVDIRKFDNLNITLKKTKEQIEIEQSVQQVQKENDSQVTDPSKTDKALEGLSEKDKAELLKKLQNQ